MEKRIGFFRSIFDGINMAATQVATSSSMEKNAVDEALKQLYSKPATKRIQKYDYVKFGSNDDIPAVLQTLLNKSSTHSGILHKKANMVAGEQLQYEGHPTSGAKGIAFKVFDENAGGLNTSLSAVFKKASFYYELHGAVGFLCTFDNKNVTGIKAVSPINMRCLPPNDKGEIKEWLLRHTFTYSSGTVWKNDERVVPVYDPNNIKNEMLVYIKNPHSSNEFYGTPNYISAFNFIEADYQFGVTINNSATNGFSPKVLATLIGRNLSNEQKKEQAKRLKENFQGSDGEQMIVSWVRKPEEAPDFLPLDVTNLDRTIDVMANLNDAKILTAHSVTNPSLFGVQVAGKLGNSGTEIDFAYHIFRATETMPTRDLLLDGIQKVFDYSQWKGITVSVIDLPISQEMLPDEREVIVEE